MIQKTRDYRPLNYKAWFSRFSLLSIVVLCAAKVAQAETLKTENFQVVITRNCPEGYVACDDVSYSGTNLSTGSTIDLTGRTLHTTCADGVSPCRFLGYEFRNGNYRYVVTQEGDLQVYRDGQQLLNEQGTWVP